MKLRRLARRCVGALGLALVFGLALDAAAQTPVQGPAPRRPLDSEPPVIGEGAAGRDAPLPETSPVPAPQPFEPEAPLDTFVDLTSTAVAARVNGEPIYVGQVERQLKAIFKNRPISADFLPRAQAEVLQQIVNRRIVEDFIRTKAQVVTDSELDRAVAKAKRQYGDDPARWAKHLQELGLTDVGFRQRAAAELGWPIYLNRVITDDRLRAHFDDNRSQFDAWEVHGKQILLKVAEPATQTEIEAAVSLANDLRRRINSGDLTFEDAAKQFSHAPSGASGGDLGWVKRRGALPEPVAAALYSLKPGEASQPIVTNYGVHLLWVVDGRDGPRTYENARPDVFAAVAREVFNDVAANHAPAVKVEYTGLAPYFDADGTLVAARAAPQ